MQFSSIASMFTSRVQLRRPWSGIANVADGWRWLQDLSNELRVLACRVVPAMVINSKSTGDMEALEELCNVAEDAMNLECPAASLSDLLDGTMCACAHGGSSHHSINRSICYAW